MHNLCRLFLDRQKIVSRDWEYKMQQETSPARFTLTPGTTDVEGKCVTDCMVVSLIGTKTTGRIQKEFFVYLKKML